MIKLSNFYHSKISLIILFLALLFVGFNLSHALFSKSKAEKEINDLEKEITRLGEENQKLKEETSLFLNPEFIKKEAKKRFNLGEVGESLIIIKE